MQISPGRALRSSSPLVDSPMGSIFAYHFSYWNFFLFISFFFIGRLTPVPPSNPLRPRGWQ